MNFPPFWAKGQSGSFSCWRWSATSRGEAQQLADDAAKKLAELFATDSPITSSYGYGDDRPLREPVIQEFKGPSGEWTAVITRNAYGAQVLNTARIMFIDVDDPPQKITRGLGKLFGGLFGKSNQPEQYQDALIDKAREVVQKDPSWAWRIYRTSAGYRLLATHRCFDPDDAQTQSMFDLFGADPLYRKLCRVQKCFRARLTPKPWRCAVTRPKDEWPWRNPDAEHRFMQWEIIYETASANYATCQLIKTLGDSPMDPAITPIVTIHDDMTRVRANLPLA